MKVSLGFGSPVAIALLSVMTMGAKCPRIPPPGPPGAGGGGARATGGAAGGGGGIGAGGGAADGGANSDAAADANDAAGSRAACAPSSATDVWSREAVPATVQSLSAISTGDVWMVTDADARHWDGTAWSSVLQPVAPELFDSVWAIGHDDVWVGSDHLRHWNGTAWADRTPAISATDRRFILWARNASDLWAINQGVSPSSILHWNGTAWTDRSPAMGAFTAALWGAAADDVWAIGTVINAQAGSSPAAIIHWNGTAWQDVFHPPLDASGVIPVFAGIWGSAANDVWVTGNVQGATQLWHFDGSGWSNTVQLAPILGPMWGSCANNVWAVGHNQYAHFDGATWTTGVLLDADAHLLAVGGTESDDVWAGGSESTFSGPTVAHRHPGDPAPACGNLRLDPGEECDPPDRSTCAADCQRVIQCGDGFVDQGETCDPPDGLTCDAFCHVIPTCGNGRIDPGEQCDPPVAALPVGASGLLCDANCQHPRCGNGVIESGEVCDPPFEVLGFPLWCDLTCQRPTCGNGAIDPGETCEPPSAWEPGHGTSLYCGRDCTTHDACVECHGLCDQIAGLPFSQCALQFCAVGGRTPC
jgi:hypothetical protein